VVSASERTSRSSFSPCAGFRWSSALRDACRKLRRVAQIVAAVPPGYQELLQRWAEEYRVQKLSRIVVGGEHRQDSVRAALETPEVQRAELVLVHDAARPFATAALVERVLQAAQRHGGLSRGIPPAETIKKVAPTGRWCRPWRASGCAGFRPLKPFGGSGSLQPMRMLGGWGSLLPMMLPWWSCWASGRSRRRGAAQSQAHHSRGTGVLAEALLQAEQEAGAAPAPVERGGIGSAVGVRGVCAVGAVLPRWSRRW
jgi:hypothetical protein